MKTVTHQQSIDMLLANKYKAVTILSTFDNDGSDEDYDIAIAYTEDKECPLQLHKRNLDMYDFEYIKYLNEDYYKLMGGSQR